MSPINNALQVVNYCASTSGAITPEEQCKMQAGAKALIVCSREWVAFQEGRAPQPVLPTRTARFTASNGITVHVSAQLIREIDTIVAGFSTQHLRFLIAHVQEACSCRQWSQSSL